MPLLSRWVIRTALLYLMAGTSIGALLLVERAVPLHPVLGLLRAVHIDLLLFGWMLQLVIGVGYWMLPRPGNSRGSPFPVVTAYVALNVGLLLSAAAAFVFMGGIPALVSRLMLVLAAVSFGVHVAGRVIGPR